MTWFKDSNGHISESKNKIHRLLYCPLCQKLISKADCQKLRQSSKTGTLYPVKRYHYEKYSRTGRTDHEEQENVRKKLSEPTNIEVNKIIKSYK